MLVLIDPRGRRATVHLEQAPGLGTWLRERITGFGRGSQPSPGRSRRDPLDTGRHRGRFRVVLESGEGWSWSYDLPSLANALSVARLVEQMVTREGIEAVLTAPVHIWREASAPGA